MVPVHSWWVGAWSVCIGSADWIRWAMIITPRYAIGHIPCTAGDSITAMCMLMGYEVDPEAYRIEGPGGRYVHDSWIIVPTDRHAKHNTFREMGVPRSHLCILSIRRLPAFMLSLGHLIGRGGLPGMVGGVVKRHEYTDRHRSRRLSLPPPVSASTPLAGLPDWYLCSFANGYQIVRWLRVERLREDLVELAPLLMGQEPSDSLLEEIRTGTTKRPAQYDHDWTRTFTAEDLERLYENNPVWADAEMEAYGCLSPYEYQPVSLGRTV